jgi:hypothetical protein
MIIYLTLDNDNRITGWSSNPSPGTTEIDVPETHEVLRVPTIYQYIDNQLVKDTTYQQQLIDQQNILDNQPTPLQQLGQQNTDLEIALIEKQNNIDLLGQTFTDFEISNMEKETTTNGTQS